MVGVDRGKNILEKNTKDKNIGREADFLRKCFGFLKRKEKENVLAVFSLLSLGYVWNMLKEKKGREKCLERKCDENIGENVLSSKMHLQGPPFSMKSRQTLSFFTCHIFVVFSYL